MNNDNSTNNNEETEMKDGADYISELEMEIVNLKKQVTELHNVNEYYRSDVRSNVGRIQKALHDHARDCDDQDLIDGLIDQINAATRNGFPELERCRREFDLTITYVISVLASSEEDARDQFIDGEYDHLIELSDYHEFDAEEGC